MSRFDPERMAVYRLARQHSRAISGLLETIGRSGFATLVNQLRRSTSSIPANVLEGFGEGGGTQSGFTTFVSRRHRRSKAGPTLIRSLISASSMPLRSCRLAISRHRSLRCSSRQSATWKRSLSKNSAQTILPEVQARLRRLAWTRRRHPGESSRGHLIFEVEVEVGAVDELKFVSAEPSIACYAR
jgi:hypothetical protein